METAIIAALIIQIGYVGLTVWLFVKVGRLTQHLTDVMGRYDFIEHKVGVEVKKQWPESGAGWTFGK